MDGLILVDKPPGLTSHDVVLRLRNILGLRRVGHFGTLDPMATGLLVIGIRRATRLFPVLSKLDKAYSAGIRLGLATDTYDATGRPLSSPCEHFPNEKELVRAMAQLSGAIEQLPPPYSAKKIEGRPLYKWAREKKPITMRSQRVTVYAFRLVRYSPPQLEVEVECSSGTYIRSLAHDLGLSLGCGAHLSSLRRTRVGPFKLADALSLEKIQEWADHQKVQALVRPMESLLEEWPKLILNRQAEKGLRKGHPILAEQVAEVEKGEKVLPTYPDSSEPLFRLFSGEGKFLGFARLNQEKRFLLPILILG